MNKANLQPLVSIVIPIYNVEKYLPDCLSSVLEQTYQNWVAILVNDGSSDSSKNIAEEYLNKDSRFKLINQENQGLGAARNTGVKFSSGEFLIFLDSDDLISSDALSRMVKIVLEDNDVDVVIGGLRSFYDDLVPNDLHLSCDRDFDILRNKVGNKFSFLNSIYDLDQLNTYLNIAHGKLFKLEKWNALECEVPLNLKMAEDFIPVKNYMYHSKFIALEEHAVILYRQRNNSASKSKSENCFEVFKAIPKFEEIISYKYKNNKSLLNYWHRFFIRMQIIHLYFCPDNKKDEFISTLSDSISKYPIQGYNMESLLYKSSRSLMFYPSLMLYEFVNRNLMKKYRYSKKLLLDIVKLLLGNK